MLPVEMTVNGELRRGSVESRMTLADYLRGVVAWWSGAVKWNC